MYLATLLAIFVSGAVSIDESKTTAPPSSTTSGLGNNYLDENVCVEIGRGEYTCTNNPVAVRQYIDTQQQQQQQLLYGGGGQQQESLLSSIPSRGVAQRVDGSESEKKAIQEVLKLMDDYFNKEVYALPEYTSVRDKW